MGYNTEEENSLEYLLDTMCNTFGGVMFIAIALVVVLSYIPDLMEKSGPSKSATGDVKKIRGEIQKLNMKLSEFRQSRSIKEKAMEKYKNNPNLPLLRNLLELKESNSDLARKNMEFMTQVQTVKIENKIAREELETAELELEKIKKELEELSEENRKKKESLKNEIDIVKKDLEQFKNKRKIVLQKMKSTRKIPFLVIFSGKDIYPVSDKKNDFIYSIDKDSGKYFFNLSPSVECRFEERKKQMTFAPKKGVSNADATDSAFRNIMDGIPAQRRFIWAFVKKDSFDIFIKFKDYIRENGYSIYWIPVVDDSEFVIWITDTAKYEAQ